MTEIIKKYTKVKNPGSFSGISSFKKNNKALNLKEVKENLSDLSFYTKHRPYTKTFKRGKHYAPTINDTWQIDLVDVSSIKNKKFRQNFNFILTCIDVFSKKAWAVPMTHKYALDTTNAFKKILKKSDTLPKRVYSDSGNEFLGSFKVLLKDLSISQLFSKSIHKASVVERFNRTFKTKLYRIFSFQNSNNYIDVLDDLIESYNNSYHSTIKTTPNSVNKKNESKIYDIMYGEMFSPYNPVKLEHKVGSYVRKAVEKKIFSKGYTPNWSDEKFIISNIILRNPITYKIRSIEENKKSFILEKQFYSQELQKVSKKEHPFDTYLIIDEKENSYLVKKINTPKKKEEEFWVEIDFINNEKHKISDSKKIEIEPVIQEKRVTRSQTK